MSGCPWTSRLLCLSSSSCFLRDFSSLAGVFPRVFCACGRAVAVGVVGLKRCSGSRTTCPAGPRPAWRRSHLPFAPGCTQLAWWTPTQPLRGKLLAAPEAFWELWSQQTNRLKSAGSLMNLNICVWVGRNKHKSTERQNICSLLFENNVKFDHLLLITEDQ